MGPVADGVNIKKAQQLESQERKVETPKVEYSGLCSSCKTAEGCTYTRNPEKPIMHCEEFAGYEPKPTPTNKEEIARLDRIWERTVYPQTRREAYKGLCRHCMVLDTCTFPKPESGVWFCDEYED